MGERETKRKYACWLYSVPGIGDRTMAKLLEVCPDAEGIYRGGKKLWAKVLNGRQLEAIEKFGQRVHPDKFMEGMEKEGIGFVAMGDAGYPERLRNIPDPPYGVFYKGVLPREGVLSVAVVGARECSAYGAYVAKEIGRILGQNGVQVISGMARGIDGISQQAALDAGGCSFGVLGSGVDVCYPESNRSLYERLCGGAGGVISTYPPGTLARPQNFPPRNRLVSGLADVLVVVEARHKSGTLITVDMALEQGKEVYVVPGRVTDRLSDGCNRLLRQGAGVFLSPEDFLQEIGGGRTCDGLLCEAAQGRAAQGRAAQGEAAQGEAAQGRAAQGRTAQGEAAQHRRRQCGGAQAVGLMTVRIPEQALGLDPQLRKVYAVLTLEPQDMEEIGGKLSEAAKNEEREKEAAKKDKADKDEADKDEADKDEADKDEADKDEVGTDEREKDVDISRLAVLLMRLCVEDLAVQVSPGSFALKPES